MRRVEHIMGLPVSIDIPAAPTKDSFVAAFKRLRQIDADYSPYKPESYVSKVQAGTLALRNLPAEQQTVLQACMHWNTQTGGYFNAYFSGIYDPSGYVKGWAIQQAADVLYAGGYDTFCINAGGDVLLRSANGHVWQIALQHPTDAGAVMGTVAASNQAVATSGTYARGDHITNPHTGLPATTILSATVIGPTIIAADVYATAVCAMGFEQAKLFAATIPEYRVILVSRSLAAFDSLARGDAVRLLE